MKNNFVLLFFLSTCILFITSCNEKEENNVLENNALKVDFEKFSVSVENNTLIFESEEDLKGCIDYLVEIGEENFNEFEKAIGYHSYRRTGKELAGFEDALMKTLINPYKEIVLCDYLISSDFKNKTAVAYKLDELDKCNLQTLKRSELNALKFSFDDDFFEFIDSGSLKSIQSYCSENTESGSWVGDFPNGTSYTDPEDIRIHINYSTVYYSSLFYKYLHIYFEYYCGDNAAASGFDYQTTSNCFWQNNVEGSYFERNGSGSLTPINTPGGLRSITFDKKPYNSTRRLTSYALDVYWEVRVLHEDDPFNLFQVENSMTIINECQ